MAKREFLMLAHTLDDIADHNICGWWVSEKMDGLRLWWDGGISRGLPIREVPYANIARDHHTDYNATGLWSRNSKCIRAPEWFLDMLPKMPLDGEIWGGHANWEGTSSIVKQHVPDEDDWRKVKYMVFDSPPFDVIFKDGVVDTDIFYKAFDQNILTWASARARKLNIVMEPRTREFEYMLAWLKGQEIENDHVKILDQQVLPYSTKDCEVIINQHMERVARIGGEGLMLRNGVSYWTPERSHHLLKMKRWYDSEAIVKYYVWGKKTNKGSKHLGKMGTLGAEWAGKIFEISGFNDSERHLTHAKDGTSAESMGRIFPGKQVEPGIINQKFPIGSVITFKYRDTTAAGVPKNANYLRRPSGL